METAKYVAKALGVPEAEHHLGGGRPGQPREPCSTSGQADLVFSTYSITDERKQVVDFAGPYFLAHQDLLVRRNETEITGPETLDGKNLCSVPGTTSAAERAGALQGAHPAQGVPTVLRLRAALDNSEVDAVTTDDVILAGFAAQPQYKGKLKLVGKGFSDENYGVGDQEGQHRAGRPGERRAEAVRGRRVVGSGAADHRRAVGLPAAQPADAGRRLTPRW